MPSDGEHDAPLRLSCGADALLATAWRLLYVSALVAGIFSGWPASWKTLFLAACAVCWWMTERSQLAADGQALVLGPDGNLQLGERRGRLLESAWLTSRWAVLQAEVAGSRERLLVSRARQAEGEYRKLLAWMRWRRWDKD